MRHPAQIESQIPPNNLISCHYLSQIRCQSSASGIGNHSLVRIWHVFPLIFLLLGQSRGESIVMRAFKLTTLIISRLCLRIHLCKHYANVFSVLSPESARALPVWREVTDAALMWRCPGLRTQPCGPACSGVCWFKSWNSPVMLLALCYRLIGPDDKQQPHYHWIFQCKKLNLLKWDWITLIKSYFELCMQINQTVNWDQTLIMEPSRMVLFFSLFFCDKKQH